MVLFVSWLQLIKVLVCVYKNKSIETDVCKELMFTFVNRMNTKNGKKRG